MHNIIKQLYHSGLYTFNVLCGPFKKGGARLHLGYPPIPLYNSYYKICLRKHSV